MSFVSIRCPNCAASESIPVGENQYQCRYCDNTFHYANPDSPKITVQDVQSHYCPICGRGVTAGAGNHCMACGANDLCSNCIFETGAKKLMCKNCMTTSSYGCLTCGNYSIFRCYSCVKLHEKDPSHIIARYCMDHYLGNDKSFLRDLSVYACPNCGVICPNCAVKTSRWSVTIKCKNCDNKLKVTHLADPSFLKNQNQSFINWRNGLLN